MVAAEAEADRVGEGGQVSGVEFHARGSGGGWDGGESSAALIVEDQLPSGGKWRERGPEEGVVEDQAAVDADERKGSGSGVISPEYGELYPSCLDDGSMESRCSAQRLPELPESGDRVVAGHRERWRRGRF